MQKPVKRSADPRKVFASAEHFYHALGLLRSRMVGPEMIAVIAQPTMVMSAFTSELYLKCLRCMQDGVVPRTHHLGNLYRDLAKPTRKLIEKRWDEYTPSQAEMWDFLEQEHGYKVPRDFGSAISMGAMAFEEMRYLFEESVKEAQFLIADLPTILRGVILQMRPEWEGSLLFSPVPVKTVDRPTKA